MLARTTYEFPIPGEPGQAVTLRPLSWKRLERCKNAKLKTQLESMAGLDMAAFASLRTPETATPAKPETPDVLQTYEQGEVLRLGVVGWTYEEPFSADALDDLDPLTAEAIARELLKHVGKSEAEKADFFSPSMNI